MGVIRRVDDLRRVIIPKQMCEQIGIDICDKVAILIKSCNEEEQS